MTTYRIYLPGQYRSYVTSYCATEEAGRPSWVWSHNIKRASLFAGRDAAEAAAERMEAWMRANGHNPPALRIIPITGGASITRRPVAAA